MPFKVSETKDDSVPISSRLSLIALLSFLPRYFRPIAAGGKTIRKIRASL